MARSRSSSTKWRYCHPSYYLKRPKRLALLFIAFVSATLLVWDRQTLVREHMDEVAKLSEEVTNLRDLVEGIRSTHGDVVGKIAFGGKSNEAFRKSSVPDDPIDVQRREKVKEAMLHAWNSYEKYAWGLDELQPQTKNGINSFGGLGATLIDSLAYTIHYGS